MKRIGLSLIVAAALLQATAARAAQLDKDSCAKLKTEQAQLEQGGMRGSMGKGPEWAKANLVQEKLEQIRRLIELDEQLLFRCGGRPLVLLPSDPDPAARGEVEGNEGGPPAAGAAPAKAPPAKAAKPPAAEKKAPDAEKKKTVPLTRAAPPPIDPPAKAAGKETSPAMKVTPQAAVLAAPSAATKAVAKEPAPATTVPPPGSGAAASSAKEADDKKAAAIKEAKAKAKKKVNDAYRPQTPDWTSNPFADQAEKK